MTCDNTAKLAVLIDADNASSSIARNLLAEVTKYGTAHVKRAYGDWNNNTLQGWSAVLPQNSIQPIQQSAYTRGKNATDSAMIIDAMDLLNSNHFDGFCLVSSDSDFTPLVTRIRGAGLRAYGFGEHKTPTAFVNACDEFIYVEDLNHRFKLLPSFHEDEAPEAHCSTQDAGGNDDQLQTVTETTLENYGWARLSEVGEHLVKRHPDFNLSSHGYNQLSDLVSHSPYFDIEERPLSPGKPLELFVRKRKTSASTTQF